MKIEEKISQLKTITEQLENNAYPLEESVEVYQNGMQLINEINQMLKETELKINKIQGDTEL